MERYDEALERQESVLRQRTALDQPGGFVHEELGEFHLLRDDREKAREHFGRAHELLKAFDWVDDERLSRD